MSRLVISQTRGQDRLVKGEAKLAPECQAAGLFSDSEGKTIPCSSEWNLVDTHSAHGYFYTLCSNCEPLVKKDLLEIHKDRRVFGSPESTPNTAKLEKAYEEEKLEKPNKRKTIKEQDLESVDDLLSGQGL